MKFHSKWEDLQKLRPDISIVQECASPSVLARRNLSLDPTQCLWINKADATTEDKGLGVFASDGVKIRVAACWSEIRRRWDDDPSRLDVLLPFEIVYPRRLNVLAVWSFNNRTRLGKKTMRGPVLVAIDELGNWLTEAPSLVIGDFNNHRRWDTSRDLNNFAHHLTAFDEIGFKSAYHSLNDIGHDEEPDQTHLWRAGKSYHIDYAFGAAGLLEGASCRVEPLERWCGKGGLSDHSPLVLDLL